VARFALTPGYILSLLRSDKRRRIVRKSTIYLFVLGVAVVVMSAIASAGLVVSAQNSNSSTTNTNMAKPKPKPRRHKRTAKPADTTGDATMAAPQKTGKCDPTQQEQTDLSGTYSGKVKHGTEAPMDATLTITGNNFTMTSGSDTHSGRITAVTTCGYTAVTIMMGDLTPPPPGPNPPGPHKAMSMRAKKVGDSLTLTTVPGEPEVASFTTGGASMKPRPRTHRSRKAIAPPPPTKTTP
jgi:hypothetical protein